MPMLRELIKQKATLLDHERIVDDFGKRFNIFWKICW